MESLFSHPVVGASWEGHVIESLVAVAPPDATPSFYRSSAGGGNWLAAALARRRAPGYRGEAQYHPESRAWASPCLSRHSAGKKWLVYPETDAYHLHDDIEVLPLHTAMHTLAARQTGGQ